jgi:tetratricopeptide (TPR) repeat protein
MKLAILLFLGALSGTASQLTDLLDRADKAGFEERSWHRAGPIYREAGALAESQGTSEQRTAARIGLLRADMEFSSIAAAAEQCEQLLRSGSLSQDLKFRVLRVAGDAYTNLDPGLAESTWEAVGRLANELGNPIWQNRARGELALSRALMGNVGQFPSEIAEVIRKAQEQGDRPTQSRWLAILGQGYVRFGRAEEALRLCEEAKSTRTTQDGTENMLAVVCIAQAHAAMNQLDKAIEVSKDGERRAREANAFGFIAQLLLERAALNERKSRFDEALVELIEAERLARTVSAVRLLAPILEAMARVQRRLAKGEDAERSERRGVEIARQAQDRITLPKLLVSLASTVSARGNHEEAIALLQEGVDINDATLGTLASPWLKQRLLDSNRNVYETFVDLELSSAAPKIERLFRLSERVRGRAFQDVVRTEGGGSPEITTLQKRMWKATTALERDEIYRALLSAEARHATPQWRSAPTKVVDIGAVQARLEGAETLVEYILGQKKAAALVVTKEGARVVPLAATTAIQTAVSDWVKAIETEDPKWQDKARAASKVVWEPLALKGERVIVAPDGILHKAPFEALEADGALLVDKNLVSYTPSATAWHRISTLKAAPKVLAVSAAPKIMLMSSNAKAITRGGADVVDLSKLAPLPSADDEARAALSAFGGRGTVLQDATESTFKAAKLSEASILHFALHGIANAKFPQRAALVFRPDQTSEDGLLQAHEIAGLNLQARLITLSACNSGSGPVGQEGVASLVRPFLGHASVATVVASLWPVDDAVSLRLMTEFYAALAKGADAGSALRSAKQSMRRAFPSLPPRLWAGYLTFGTGRFSTQVGNSAPQRAKRQLPSVR